MGYTLQIDGFLGDATFAALNEVYSHGMEDEFIQQIVNNQNSFYELLVKIKPKFQVFLKGWLNRAAYQGT